MINTASTSYSHSPHLIFRSSVLSGRKWGVKVSAWGSTRWW